MKQKKTILSILFLAVLMFATYTVLAQCGKELDFGQMLRFLQVGKPLHFACALVCMCLFVVLEGVSLRRINQKLGWDTGFTPNLIYSAADVYYSAITPSAAGGQPASGYYMVRDGIPLSAATSSLMLNIVCYTASLDIIGVAAMATNFPLFLRLAWPVQLLILLGIGIQFVLLVFFLLCMFKSDLVLGMSRGVIRFLGKLHLVRDPAAKEEKIHHTVEQYAQCVSLMAGSRRLFLEVLVLNLAQRVVQMLITCFVCTAVPTGLNFGQVLARQAFCLTGSNSIPLPGSVGAFEYLYIGIFGLDISPRRIASVHDDGAGNLLLSVLCPLWSHDLALPHSHREKVIYYARLLSLRSYSYLPVPGQLGHRHLHDPQRPPHHLGHRLPHGVRLSGRL